jgi:hypothetical protein
VNVQVDVENEDYDDPSMLEHIIPQNPDPTGDPMHNQQTMVYNIGQEVTII